MWSIRTIIWYCITRVLFLPNRLASESRVIKSIINNYKENNSPETVPKSISKDRRIKVKETWFESSITKGRWQIFTSVPVGSYSLEQSFNKIGDGKLVVHFHGGAWVRAGRSPEWEVIIRHALLKHQTPVMYPVWTLAPLSCATEFAKIALEFIISIAEDSQWEGREIVLSGTSAGGWCALRTLTVLCETALGIDNLHLNRSVEESKAWRERAASALMRIRQVILFSPATTLETEGLVEADKRVRSMDIWLSHRQFNVVTNLWAYGPAALPSILAAIPSGTGIEATRWKEETEGVDLRDPRFSPARGLDVLQKVIQVCPEHPPFEITNFHGTADMLYPSSAITQDRLVELGSRYVKSELHTAEGMWHAWMMFPIQEAKLVLDKFSLILDG